MSKEKTVMSWAIMCSLSWLPVAMYALFLKRVDIDAKYFPLLYSVSNIGERPGYTDRLFMYKDDLFLGFVLMPLLIILSLYFLPRKRWLAAGWLCASLLAVALLYANMHSWGTVGRFMTYTAAVEAFSFGLQNPNFIGLYIDVESWTKISIITVTVVLGFSLAGRLCRVALLGSGARYGVGVVLLLAGGVSLAGSLSAMKATPIARSYLVSSIAALTDRGGSSASGDVASPAELVEAFRQLAGTTGSPTVDGPYAAAKENDLIVFIVETGSSRFVDLKNDLEDFPTLQRLSGNSLLAFNHHSTFPASSESLFSFFFSLYPPRSYYSTCVVGASLKFTRPFPGFVSSLKDMGYHTATYLPFRDALPLDLVLRANLGFDRVYYAQSEERLDGRDQMALDTMKKDISGWLRSGERYAVVFLPQAGHAPWPGRPKSRSISEHGKMVAARHDKWLGEVVDILAKYGRLDRTVIVFTGDHGIRTTAEDPDFRSGFIDEYSFRVPLMIYSKAAFPEPVYINELTSHIDVSPSLQNLFGVVRDHSPEQGVSLWDKSISKRSVFFLGNWYLGADGFRRDGRFAMYSEVLDISFASDRLSFNIDSLSRNPEETREIRKRVRDLYELQQRWVKAFLCR